ncbi:hypothetical protein SAMN04490243_1818 [Robiginitalea myxolifaciens]|uniref:Uncharacterized protein n=2 Tax=Robiginitalea myxolifaciens TaxID=400055 RepID=A0A1I6GWF7_9FLAO|nr:hypothetical protein SAMN04490243_1818 [Robiginitalea myxolifaciens]
MWYVLTQLSLFGLYSLFYIFTPTRIRIIFLLMSFYHYMAFFAEILGFGLSSKIVFSSEGLVLMVFFFELILIRNSKYIKRIFLFDDNTSSLELFIEAIEGRNQKLNKKILEVRKQIDDSRSIRDIYQLYYLKVLAKKELQKYDNVVAKNGNRHFIKNWIIPICLILMLMLKIWVYYFDESNREFNLFGVWFSHSFGFVDAKSFAWYFTGKLEIIVYSIAWIIYSESWWKYVILPGICLYCLQFWEIFQSKLSLETDITIQAIPLTIAVVIFSSVITKLVLTKAQLLDNIEYLEDEMERRLDQAV